MNKLPISPGLLISMAIRFDHSFGVHAGVFDTYETLEEKQVSLLDLMAKFYSGLETTGGQIMEEMTGEGFYSFDKEHVYRNIPTLEGLEKAVELATSIRDDQHDTK